MNAPPANDAVAGSPGALAGRVVLVTGASGGLGNAAALACARAGARVVLLGRKVPRLNRVYDAVAAEGLEPLLYPMDLEGATPDDHAQVPASIESELGRLDGLMHCVAEFRGLTPLMHTDPGAFARAIHVNLTAPWWLTQACLPLLSKAADASVVFAVDDLARVGKPFWGGYGISHHGLAGLVRMLHAELANSPVRIAGLCPGPMRTALRARAYADDADPTARSPEEFGAACVELLSPAGAAHRGQVWMPGAGDAWR